MASKSQKPAKSVAPPAAGKKVAAKKTAAKKTAPKAPVKAAPAVPAKRGRKKAVALPSDDDLGYEAPASREHGFDRGDELADPLDQLNDDELDNHRELDDEDAALTAEPPVGEEAAWLVADAPRRKAVVPPPSTPEGMTLFDYLCTCTPPLDKKIIDIAIAQTKVPQELSKDAAQEIRLVWSTMKPDLARFKPGQIASYAHRMAKHTALKVRRDLGSSVRLPGSAFRKRRDGSSYVTPGVLSVALDWNELEGWMEMDEAMADAFGTPLLGGLGEQELLGELGSAMEASSVEDDEEEILKQRVKVLESYKEKLTERQYQILMRLSRGDTYEDVQRALGIKKGVLTRDIQLAACVIGVL